MTVRKAESRSLTRAARRNAAKDNHIPWNFHNPYWTNLNAKRAAERAAKLAKEVEEQRQQRLKEAGHQVPTESKMIRRRVV